MKFDDAFAETPLIAIVRGVTPAEITDVADALYQAGVRIVEVPMNSPAALESVSLLAKTFAERLVFGAGTVLKENWVDQISAAGGKIIVAPNTNPNVIRRSREQGLVPIPGFATATEAFAAYDAGARHLKLFPASSQGRGFLEQLFAVLPPDALVLPVGGIAASDISAWWKAGARGFGIGSEIYRPGQPAQATYTKALAMVTALRETRAG